MINRIYKYLDDIFAPYSCDDYSNNGLQVEAARACNTIAFAVDACGETINKAAEMGADLLVVHHGLSWGDGFRRLQGLEAARFAALFKNNISLYAMHLPLDGHMELGNNAVMARSLGFLVNFMCYECRGLKIGTCCKLDKPMDLNVLNDKVQRWISPYTLLLDNSNGKINSIVFVSGGGAAAISECARLGADCLITGEFIHQYYHEAKELGISVISAGHYNTEKTGIKALMANLQNAFPNIKCFFVDSPTGL